MVFLRRLGLGVATSLVSLLLLVFALFAALYAVVDSPTALKDALRQSGIYSVFAENTLKQKQAEGKISLPLGNEVIAQATQQAFSPAYLQATNEQLIDQTYSWVRGTTPRLDLSIDLTGPKTSFADYIATYARERLATMPICRQLAAPPATLEGLLAMNCKPPGISDETIVTTARQQALESQFFNEIAFRPDTVKNAEGQTLGEQLAFVPAAHRYYIMSLYLIPVVIVLCALAVIYWSATRRGGVKRIAHILLAAGIATALVAVVVVWGLDRVVDTLGKHNSEFLAVQGKLVYVVDVLAAQLRTWLVGFGVVYVLVAIGLLVIIKLRDRGTLHEVEALNKSLGYNTDIPSAGTTFDPKPPKRR